MEVAGFFFAFIPDFQYPKNTWEISTALLLFYHKFFIQIAILQQNVKYQSLEDQKKATAYWKENITYVLILLVIWFLVSYGAGILFKDFLDNFSLAGFPLGFWFAQQGSIYVFVILIFIYVYLMNRLDKKYGYNK